MSYCVIVVVTYSSSRLALLPVFSFKAFVLRILRGGGLIRNEYELSVETCGFSCWFSVKRSCKSDYKSWCIVCEKFCVNSSGCGFLIWMKSSPWFYFVWVKCWWDGFLSSKVGFRIFWCTIYFKRWTLY